MTALLRHPMTKVWLLLTTATLVLFSLFENEHAVRVMTSMTILIAGFKVRLVFLHFMELDSGAMPWRAIAEVWLAAVTAMMLFSYLQTPL